MKLTYLLFILAQLFCVAALADFVPQDDNIYIPQTQPLNKTSKNTLRTTVKPRSHGLFSLVEGDAGAMSTTAVGSLVNGASSNRISFMGGATMDLFRGSFVFETGLQYRQMGYDLPSYGMDINAYGNYLSVPTFLKFYFSGHPENSFFAKVGCYNSFLMSKQESTTSAYNNTFTTTDVPLNQFDWAPAVGLGGMLRLSGNMLLVIQATYAQSVTSVFNYNAPLYYSSIGGTAGIAIKL